MKPPNFSLDFFVCHLFFNVFIQKENLDFNFLWEFLSRLSGKYILSLKRIVYAIILSFVLFLLYTFFIPPLFSLSYQLCFGCNGKAHGEHWGTNCSVPLLIKQYVPLNLNILFFCWNQLSYYKYIAIFKKFQKLRTFLKFII